MKPKQPLDLLEKFLQGKCTPDEEKVVHEWYDSLGRHRLTRMDNEDHETARKTRIFSAIQHQIILNEKPLRSPARSSRMYLAAAIIAFLICAIPAITYLLRTSSDEFHISGVIEQANITQESISCVLPDGSQVILEPGATLSYPEKFDAAQRDVILEGEAFFNVKRDTLSPFRVHTGGLTTQVLGTSFTIRAPDHAHAIEVVVRTGKVSVYEGHDMGHHPEAVILTPNQKVEYVVEEKKLIQSIVEQPVVVATTSPELHFENATLEEVAKRLIELYHINIRIDNEAIKICPITASFDDQDLYTRIDMICKALGATYAITEKEIVLTGGSCE